MVLRFRRIALSRRASLFVCIATLGVMSCASGLHAQEFPTRPMTFVVPFPTGGIQDIVARLVAERLAAQVGQPVRVENRPGSSGIIGAAYVAQATPDGHTLLLADNTLMTITPHLFRDLPFNPASRLAPVTPLVENIPKLYVDVRLPVRTLAELIAYARNASPHLAYGSPGSGSVFHLATERLMRLGGFPLLHVPYKNGGQAVAAAGTGEVALVIAGANADPYLRLNKLRPIATAGEMRSPASPQVQTISETFPGYQLSLWQGVFAATGISGPRMERIEIEIGRVLSQPEIRRRLAGAGDLQPVTLTRLQFAERIRQESEANRAMVERLDLKVD
jgi:tripartite-type tricarboxylate transporter receptor subunit TctC